MADNWQIYKNNIKTLNGSSTTPSDCTGDAGEAVNQNFIAIANNFANLGTASTANTGTSNGNVPVISGGTIPGSIIPTLNQNTTGTSANVTGTVAIANGGTGATTESTALTALGGMPTAGGTFSGNVSMGGHALTNVATIKDNQSTSKIRIGVGGATGTSDTQINDVNGTTQIDVSSGLVTVENALTVTGAFTAHAELSASDGQVTTNSGIISALGFICPSFVANSTIYVDPVNGNDDTNNGGFLTPYASPSAAAAVATNGNLIFLMPGIYAENLQIILPNGVSMKGSGIGVTILQPTSSGVWASGLSAMVVPGNGSDISDLTIDLTASQTANRPSCIGCNDSASNGSAQGGLNPSMHRIKCINTGTCFIYNISSTSGTSYIYLEDCIWVSNNRCAQWIMSSGTLTVDEFRCQHYFTYAAGVTNSNIGECAFAQGKPSRFFNCLLSMTDTINTSWSDLGYQSIDADSPVELYGTHIITNFPNLPAVPLTTTAGTDNGYWAFSNTNLCKIGAGCTVNPQVSDIGQSLYQTLPSLAPHNYILLLGVTSSAVTPWGESGNNLFEVAADAGSLTAATLTINNVAVGNNAGSVSVALADGQEMELRIKNTNAVATAMILAFGTTYNTGAYTVATLAAGKTAYLEFKYNAGSSKWDLKGYATGI